MSRSEHLAQWERYTINWFLVGGYSLTYIGQPLERSPSTISRELRRDRSPHEGIYRAKAAHGKARARPRREREGSQFSKREWWLVKVKLKKLWSPDQIAERLRLKKKPSINHETIYRWIQGLESGLAGEPRRRSMIQRHDRCTWWLGYRRARQLTSSGGTWEVPGVRGYSAGLRIGGVDDSW
jgi:IS30 family transposase